MVFKELYAAWKKKGLLSQVMEELNSMFDEDLQMYQSSIKALFEGNNAKVDIYEMDKEVNTYEMKIRKKVLEHLSISACQDVTDSLLLIGIARDTERIGDFCKNIYELSYLYGKPLESGKYVVRLIKATQQLEEMFELTKKAFSGNDEKAAKKVIELHKDKMAFELSKMTEDIMNDKMDAKKAVTCTLASRFLKRISAHLFGICGAILNPFDRIRGRVADVSLIPQKNVPAWKLKKK